MQDTVELPMTKQVGLYDNDKWCYLVINDLRYHLWWNHLINTWHLVNVVKSFIYIYQWQISRYHWYTIQRTTHYNTCIMYQIWVGIEPMLTTSGIFRPRSGIVLFLHYYPNWCICVKQKITFNNLWLLFPPCFAEMAQPYMSWYFFDS